MERDLACFCCFCMERKWFACLYAQWIGEWKLETLKPIDIHFAQFIMEEENVHDWDYGEDGNALAPCLEIGDNYVINIAIDNDESQKFWIIKCSKPLHKVKENFIDAWGSSYEVGNNIVVGTYYQKWGTYESSYVIMLETS